MQRRLLIRQSSQVKEWSSAEVTDYLRKSFLKNNFQFWAETLTGRSVHLEHVRLKKRQPVWENQTVHLFFRLNCQWQEPHKGKNMYSNWLLRLEAESLWSQTHRFIDWCSWHAPAYETHWIQKKFSKGRHCFSMKLDWQFMRFPNWISANRQNNFFKLWDVEKNDPKLKCWITWFKIWQFRKIRFKNLKRCIFSIWKTDTLWKFCFKLWFFKENFAGEPCFFEKPKNFRSSTFNDVRRMKALFFTHFI